MFEIETGLIFWTVVSFVILLALLYKVVAPPLQKILAERRRLIESQLEHARQARAEAGELLRQHLARLAETERKTAEMFDEARRESRRLRAEKLKNAQQEARRITGAAREEIESLKRRALFSMKAEITNIIVEVSGRLTRKVLSEAEHYQLIASSIEELEGNAKGKV